MVMIQVVSQRLVWPGKSDQDENHTKTILKLIKDVVLFEAAHNVVTKNMFHKSYQQIQHPEKCH